MVRLYTSFYFEKNESRREELIACLTKNAAHVSIGEVRLLIENLDDSPVWHEKIKILKSARRPNYSDYFRLAAEQSTSSSDITIIANSDIYFDNSILALGPALKPNQCAALSRWEITPSGGPVLFDRNDSQDLWVFRGPLKQIRGDFPVGVPRCDNRMLYELQRAGYEVINPAFSVRAYHLHAGIRQEYSEIKLDHFVDPPYAYLWPHNLWSFPRTVLYNLSHPGAELSWRFDRRKFERLFTVRAVRKIGRLLKRQSA